MKTINIFSLIFLLTVSFAYAQRTEKREQVKSLKVAFITSELELTSDEAAKFWPVYNTYEEKQKDIRKKKVGAYLDRRDASENLTDKEASALLSQMEANEEDLYQLRKKFISNLKSILPAAKIIKLKEAEEDFNRKLLKQYRQKGAGKTPKN